MEPELPLFRAAAVAAQRRDGYGGIVLACPPAFAALGGLLAVVAGSLVALGYFGSYTAHSTLRGRLVPERGVIEVASAAAGVIVEKHAAEGRRVATGDVLYAISSEQLTRSGTAAREAVAAQLARRRASLLAQMAATRELEHAERATLAARLAAARRESERLEAALGAERRRFELAEQAAERFARMGALGFVAEEQRSAREAAVLEQQSRMSGLERERAGLARAVAELEGRAATLGLEYANALAELERAVAATELEIIDNDALRASVVVAPQAGIVTAPVGEVGQPVERGAVLARIVPDDTALVAELVAPSRAVGFLAAGDEVRLRYAAFPYQKFGHAQGTVISVSQATVGAVADAREAARSEPVYRVAVALRAQSVLAYGEPRPLLPGMEVEADVLLETRRLYEWALEPLYALAKRL